LRVAIPSSFSFDQSDLDSFFSQYGKIEKIKIFKTSEDQQGENTAYIFYGSYYSAVLALRVLQSIPDSDVIVKGKVCIDEDNSE
jgi:RNA recognition motif-containing protein